MSTNAYGICLDELRQNIKLCNHDSTILVQIGTRQIQKISQNHQNCSQLARFFFIQFSFKSLCELLMGPG